MASGSVAPATKPFWQSTTIWGVGITVLGTVLQALEGASVIPAGTSADLSTIVTKLSEIVGPIVTVIGRFRATTPITLGK